MESLKNFFNIFFLIGKYTLPATALFTTAQVYNVICIIILVIFLLLDLIRLALAFYVLRVQLKNGQVLGRFKAGLIEMEFKPLKSNDEDDDTSAKGLRRVK